MALRGKISLDKICVHCTILLLDNMLCPSLDPVPAADLEEVREKTPPGFNSKGSA